MRPRTIPIETLLLRTFLPAVVVVAIALAILVYNLLYATILDGFEKKLITTSALAGAMIDPHDHDRLIAAAIGAGDPVAIEASDLYRRNVEPLRRIRSELGLTYLYTQTIGGPQDILYVLDGSLGEDHSPIGSADALPENTVAGLAEVQRNGTIYVSPIQYQDQWGLLKTAAAPVRGANGGISASAGADVNISVIQVATQNALFASAMIGVGSVIACLIVALVLVRRIARPIAALTDDTLRLAAGVGNRKAAGPEPREVAQLRGALDALAAKLETQARSRDEALAHHQEKTAETMLRTIAGSEADAPVLMIDDHAGLRVVWLPGEGAHGILARHGMARLAARIATAPELARSWQDLVDLRHGGWLALDRTAGSAEWNGASTLHLRIGDQPEVLEPGGRTTVDAREPVAVERKDGTRFVVWAGTEP